MAWDEKIMRKYLAIFWWLFLPAWIVLDRLATAHTLPSDIQSLWDKYMIGLSTFAHVALALTMAVLLYLYWPLLNRLMPDRVRNVLSSDPIAKSANWVNMDQGARYYRDLLVKSGMAETVRMFDKMADPVLPDIDGLTFAFRFVVEDGIAEKQMDVWGVPENGSAPEKLTKPDDSVRVDRKRREGDSLCIV